MKNIDTFPKTLHEGCMLWARTGFVDQTTDGQPKG